ncbi:hypothetical protein B0H14DRAFT_2335175, partial [Mycena olivaceomarginata]
MESRFSRRLNTNYIPSDEEVDFIRIELVSHTQELARIDERIRELSAQRDKIQAYIEPYRALISHPRRLPADILREIFIACLPASRNAVISAREAPLLLGRICSAWRTIAVSTPRLWASLHAPLDYILEKEPRKLAVIEWLQRSGAAPISLSVFPERNWDAWSEGPSLLKSLAESSVRWCHLDLVNFLGWSGLEEQLAEISTPALESLKFSGSVSSLRNLNIVKAQGLRAVALHANERNERIDEFILEMPLVWNRLTYLTLVCDRYGPDEGISLRNIIVLLRRCTQLISFKVSLPPPQFSGLILLPYLQTFIIAEGSLGSQSLGYLIDHVSMPRLRQFSAETLGGPTSRSIVALGTGSPLIQELGNLHLPSLQGQPDSFASNAWLLKEDREWIESHPIEVILESFSSLTRLVVSGGYGSHPHLSELLHALTPGDNLEAVLCPAVRELVVTSSGGLESSLLNTFVGRRIRLAQGFRRLEIQNSPVPDLISKAEIEFYCSQGVDISNYIYIVSLVQKIVFSCNRVNSPAIKCPSWYNDAIRKSCRRAETVGKPFELKQLGTTTNSRRSWLRMEIKRPRASARVGIELKLRPWWEQKTGLGSMPADPISLDAFTLNASFGARACLFIQMESRFSRRLNTNYIPSDEEIDLIRMELVLHTQELARIDEHIRELSAQRDQIQAYIEPYRALISHSRRLPVDILREIFVACLPANRNAVMSAREAPLLLGRICSAWRTIALSTPRLWASLHAPLDYILEKEPRKLAVIEWLQRSGAAPISLS